MSDTLDGARWEDVGNQEDFLYVYGGGTDWNAAKAGWISEHNQYLMDHGWNDNSNSGNSSDGSSSGNAGNSDGSNSKGNGTLTNPANNTAAIQAANYAAQIKYQNARLKQLEIPQFKWMKEQDKEKMALAEATQEWLKTYQTSIITGKFKGQDTVAWAAQQAALTGYFNGAPTLEREKQEADNVFRTAQLLASLRGPKNAFQMSEVITNGGLQGVLGGASGKYGLPSFGGGTGRPEPVTLAGFLGDAANGVTGQPNLNASYNPGQNQYGYGSGQPSQVQSTGIPSLLINQLEPTSPSQRNGVSYSPPGQTAPQNQYNYQGSPDGNSYIYPPGAEAPQQAAQVSSPTPQDPSVLNAQTGGGLYGYGSGPQQGNYQNTMGAPQATAAVGAPTQVSSNGEVTLAQNDQLQPYQLNGKTVGRLNPYNKDLLWAYYESKGWDPAAAEAEYTASLPRYGGPQSGRIAGIV